MKRFQILYSREQKVFHLEDCRPTSGSIDAGNGFIIIGAENSPEEARMRLEFWANIEAQDPKFFERYLDTLECFNLFASAELI